MTTQAAGGDMDETVTTFLDRQFAHAPGYKAYLLCLWQTYRALGLPNARFVSGFTSGKLERVCQYAWEMMLARHLDALGYELASPDHGPDFRFEHRGLTVWVEAICPEPTGLPTDWMADPVPNSMRVIEMPHDKILLKWTGAFKEKWEKLQGYVRDKIVADNDAYVIAINGCQLGKPALHHGVSRYPYALEAVYPVGPWAYRINPETSRIEQPHITERFNISTKNGSPVYTTPFVNPAYVGVSAVMACTLSRSNDAVLPVDVIHNHFARVRVPVRILGETGEEFIPEPVGTDGEEIELRKLTAAALA